MTIKRRSFLTLLGAAIAAPAAAISGPALPANIGALAAAHVRKYPFVSTTGLSNRLGLSVPQAQRLLLDLSRSGLVGPVQSCARGPIHAASKVFTPTSDSLIRVAQARAARQRAAALRRIGTDGNARRMRVDLRPLLRHLHEICRDTGLDLHPRALAAAR